MDKPKMIPPEKKPWIIAAASAAVMVIYLVSQTVSGSALFASPVFWNMVLALGGVLTALFLLTFYLHTIRKLPLHILAAIVIPVLGLAYMTVIPLNTIPDGWIHIRAAYERANELSGIEAVQEDGLIMMRADDAAVSFLPWTEGEDLPNRFYDKNQYVTYWERFGTPLSDGTYVPGVHKVPYPYWIHHNFMPAMGIVTGRLLGLGTYDTLLAGRLFALAFYAAMVSWSVFLMPVKKTMLFLVAAMPMAIQQGMSYSYDCMVNALAFWLFAMSMHLIFRTDITGKRFLFSYALLVLGSILMVYSKQHAYFILALLPVLVFYHREFLPKKMILISGVVCALLACIAVFVFASRLMSVGYDAVNALHVLIRSLLQYTGILVADCVGTRLGSIDVASPTLCIAGFVALLVLSALRKKGTEVRLTWEDRLILSVVVAGGYLCFAIGHLVYVTPPDAMLVEGMQGRYLIPVIAPLLLLLDSDAIACDERADALAVPASVFLHFFVIIQLLLLA